MYPQSELSNYKLQVELLQEKLKHSEENREQLTLQLEQIYHKRCEHDKSMRLKSRQKYQEFLDEQRKRNERNKLLMQMLERVDEQTTALSARSERLKMMKLQYEMYFAKLVQAQTMRCIQPTAAAPAAIPVLLPTSAHNSNNNNNNSSSAKDAPMAACTADQQQQQTPRNTAEQMATPLLPPQLQQQQQQWTLAMATPTPAGMLLSSGAPTAALTPNYLATAGAFDYLRYPIGYVASPRLLAAPQHAMMGGALQSAAMFDNNTDFHQANRNFYYSNNAGRGGRACHEAFHDGGNTGHNNNNNNNSYYQNYNDPGATLRDFDKMNDALALPLKETAATTTTKANMPGNRSDEPVALASASPKATTTPATPMNAASLDRAHTDGHEAAAAGSATPPAADVDKLLGGGEPHRMWQQQQMPPQLSQLPAATAAASFALAASAPALTAASSLTFDKLPNSLLDRTKENIARIDAALPALRAAAAAASTYGAGAAISSFAAAAPAGPREDKRNDVAAALAAAMKPQIEMSASDFAPQPVPFGIVGNANLAADNSHVAYTGSAAATRQKIDEAAQLPGGSSAAAGGRINGDDWFGKAGVKAPALADDLRTQARNHQTAANGLAPPNSASADDTSTAFGAADEVTTGLEAQHRRPQAAAAAAASNQYTASPLAAAAMPEVEVASAGPVSIENIENAIYGELVKPPAVDDAVVQLRSPTQGVLENFLALPQAPAVGAKLPQIVSVAPDNELTAAAAASPNDYATYATIGGDEAASVSEASYQQEASDATSYDPTYATIDGTNSNNAEMYAAASATAADGSAYGENLGGDAAADPADQQQQQQQEQQEYDYSNYDASQYGGAYDPNAYPGYTYDEATGQYIADDPNQQQQEQQQYATDEAYAAAQAYDQQQQPQQYEEASQEQPAVQPYDYGTYDQEAANAAYDEGQSAAVDEAAASAELAPNVAEAAGSEAAAVKQAAKAPTSILSSSTAAANDALAKKKKRVNFVDSSETDDSSSLKAADAAANNPAALAVPGVAADSDFEFSASEQAA